MNLFATIINSIISGSIISLIFVLSIFVITGVAQVHRC